MDIVIMERDGKLVIRPDIEKLDEELINKIEAFQDEIELMAEETAEEINKVVSRSKTRYIEMRKRVEDLQQVVLDCLNKARTEGWPDG